MLGDPVIQMGKGTLDNIMTPDPKCVEDLTLEKRTPIVGSDTCVSDVEVNIKDLTAQKRKRHESWKRHVQNLKYARGFIWVNNLCPSTPSVSATILQGALHGVPKEDAVHIHVTEMIE